MKLTQTSTVPPTIAEVTTQPSQRADMPLSRWARTNRQKMLETIAAWIARIIETTTAGNKWNLQLIQDTAQEFYTAHYFATLEDLREFYRYCLRHDIATFGKLSPAALISAFGAWHTDRHAGRWGDAPTQKQDKEQPTEGVPMPEYVKQKINEIEKRLICNKKEHNEIKIDNPEEIIVQELQKQGLSEQFAKKYLERLRKQCEEQNPGKGQEAYTFAILTAARNIAQRNAGK